MGCIYKKIGIEMAYNKFLIAPFDSGLDTRLKPWLIPDSAFTHLENAYISRGVLKKRVGSNLTGVGASSSLTKPLYSRLSILLGVTDGAGDISGTTKGIIFKVGQMFSVGDEMFTVTEEGTPGTMLTTGAATVHTYDTITGAYVINGAAALGSLYFYPAESVMGLTLYENGVVNNQPSYAFDTQFIYKYSSGYWVADYTTIPFTGTNKDFFNCCNWRGITPDLFSIFASNFTTDSIISYNGTTWAAFKPSFLVAATNTVDSANLIAGFKDRLLFLGTKETVGGVAKVFKNRIRYSHNGSPYAASAFYEAGEVGASGGGYIDAPIKEDIISFGFIKDRLIVYFENSCWELIYTGNYMLPYVWQSLNTEMGSVNSSSTVAFDKVLLTISNNGITACDGNDIERVDEIIPDKVFDVLHTASGIKQIHGIRDFYNENVYWTYRDYDNSLLNHYPDKLFVFNYNNKTWAFNDDCFTCFGLFEQESEDVQPQARKVIAGNQQGFILSLNNDKYTNAPALQISSMVSTTDITLIVEDHNHIVGDYIYIKNAQGIVLSADSIYQVTERTDKDTIKVDGTFTGTYTGGGTLSRVSKISVKSKQWNPFISKGNAVYIPKISFCVKKTTYGEVLVDYSVSGADLSMVDESGAGGTACILGDNILDTKALSLIPFESQQSTLWHSVSFQGEGDNIQIHITLTDKQMRDFNIVTSDFQLQGMILYAQQLLREV